MLHNPPKLPPPGWQRYPQKDFCQDFAFLVQQPMRPAEEMKSALEKHFARYADVEERGWRFARVHAATMYLLRKQLDWDALSAGHHVIANFPPQVQLALWWGWADETIDPNTFDPPFDDFLSLCAHFEEQLSDM